MADRVRDVVGGSQSAESDRDLARRSQLVDRYLGLLRDALTETGWTLDALAAYYDFDRSHAHRLLTGEKPWTVRHLLRLPHDVEARFVRLYAERLGWIVVERVDAATAERQLASGLFNVLAGPRLPERADRLARAFTPLKRRSAAGE